MSEAVGNAAPVPPADDPRAVARSFYDVINGWSPDGLDRICDPDLRGHVGAGSTLLDLKASVGSFAQSFPDLVATPKHLVVEGDTVSAWVQYVGTHQGEFAGVPPSGREVRFAAWDLFRVKDGRIVEITQYCDLFTLLNQIGALPTTSPA